MTRAGLSYQDWRAMARWQRLDFLARHQLEVKTRLETARKGWKETLGAIVQRLLG